MIREKIREIMRRNSLLKNIIFENDIRKINTKKSDKILSKPSIDFKIIKEIECSVISLYEILGEENNSIKIWREENQ